MSAVLGGGGDGGGGEGLGCMVGVRWGCWGGVRVCKEGGRHVLCCVCGRGVAVDSKGVGVRLMGNIVPRVKLSSAGQACLHVHRTHTGVTGWLNW